MENSINNIYTSEALRNFSDALRHEIIFLKQGKGKRHKIANGSKINNEKGIYTYLFEMETELHLSEDAAVVVDTWTGLHAVGTVLLCEDFQITLLLDSDLGDSVQIAYLMVEPWKLLETLNSKFVSLNKSNDKLAVKLMHTGPLLATKQNISIVPKGQIKVKEQVNKEDIVAVWGPPGTGKTYTMADVAIEYLKEGKTVLIVSHSNVSVDGVIKKIVDLIPDDMEDYLRDGKILRYGYVRDEQLSKHPYATSFQYALNKHPEYSTALEKLLRKIDKLRLQKRVHTIEYDNLQKEIKEVREKVRKEERKYVADAQLIGTTISQVTVNRMFENKKYDLVMFDEVSMAYVPQVAVAASFAREKFVFVGDFMQLPPISLNPSANLLQTDIFSYLRIVDSRANMFWHPWLVLLNEQRRMHPDISEFPNRYVYKRLLKDHSSVEYSLNYIVNASPLPGDALNLIDLSGTYSAADKNSDNSRFNILSAVISFATAINCERNGADSIGIIAPYAAQVRLIRAMLKDYYNKDNTAISCATVHQFQGSESDVLIFDAVESYPKNSVGYLMGKDFKQVTRLINVAITRARGKLITIAYGRLWDNVFSETTHIFYKFLCHIRDRHQVISQKDKKLLPYVESINPNRVVSLYVNEEKAMALFEQDMKKAQGKVLVSIPDGELRESHVQILKIIKDTEAKGVDILMKSNDTTHLPKEWKSYCQETENATFPLIVIDDEIVWYGLPTSKMKFTVDKTRSLMTIADIVVRIKGKNTVGMITFMAELDTIILEQRHSRLVKKNDNCRVETGIGKTQKQQGLAMYIEKNQFCPECKSFLILSKGKSGKAYLRCSNKYCEHVEYLTKDIINCYIDLEYIKCPRDGGKLTGGVGRYGPYVRCSCGHFLNPEDI